MPDFDIVSAFIPPQRIFKGNEFLGPNGASENGSKRFCRASLPTLTSPGVAGIYLTWF
jgi:hypothetical protein